MPRLVAAILCLLPALAVAGDTERSYVWDLAVDGQPVGSRTLTVHDVGSGDAAKRVLSSWTEISVKLGPMPFAFRQRLSAVAGEGPAAFQASIDANGTPRVVQGRKAGGEWRVSIGENHNVRQWALGSTEVDLSTVDLVDPGTKLPLWRMSEARVLSAETGGILTGSVSWDARGDVEVGGMGVPVDRYKFEASDGTAYFSYSGDGTLVRYDMRLFGRTVTGTLRTLPATPDDAPVGDGGDTVESTPL